MFDQRILQRVEEAFAEKRRLAEETAEQHRREAEKMAPDLKKINDELSHFSLKVLAESLRGKDPDRLPETIRQLQKENRDLMETQSDLLEAVGLPRDYLRPKRECPICKDTGFVNDRFCICMKKAILAESAKESGVSGLLKRQTFNSFSLDFYSAEPLPGKAGSARDTMKTILSKCKKYAEQFSEDSPSLLFIGGTGLGKTHLSSAIAGTLLQKGFNVVYETAANLVTAYEKERFLPESEMVRTPRYLEADLLILDDLGTESQGKTANSVIYNLINSRTLVAGKPMIISTNLSRKELEKIYDPPTTSRLFGEFTVYTFVGGDVRRAKLVR